MAVQRSGKIASYKLTAANKCLQLISCRLGVHENVRVENVGCRVERANSVVDFMIEGQWAGHWFFKVVPTIGEWE